MMLVNVCTILTKVFKVSLIGKHHNGNESSLQKRHRWSDLYNIAQSVFNSSPLFYFPENNVNSIFFITDYCKSGT